MNTSTAVPTATGQGQDVTDRSAIERLRRARSGADVDVLQLSETVVPMPDASMRVLEFLIASIAIVVALILGLAH